jgi:hypothetical protein
MFVKDKEMGALPFSFSHAQSAGIQLLYTKSLGRIQGDNQMFTDRKKSQQKSQ